MSECVLTRRHSLATKNADRYASGMCLRYAPMPRWKARVGCPDVLHILWDIPPLSNPLNLVAPKVHCLWY